MAYVQKGSVFVLKKCFAIVLAAIALFGFLEGCGFRPYSGRSDNISRSSTRENTAAQSTEQTTQAFEQAEDAGKTDIKYEFTNTQERLYESLGETRWETLIEITNIGTTPIYLGSSKYDLTDGGGNILRACRSFSTFPDIIHASEKGYFYDSTAVSVDEFGA